MKLNIGGEDWYGHFGNQVGSGAIMLYSPTRDLTFIALQNTGTFLSIDIRIKFFYHLISDIESIIL